MLQYYQQLNKHKNLSLKRKSDYKRNLIITALMITFSMTPLMLLFVPFLKETSEAFSAFCLPVIIILDFSLRFFLKKNASVGIIPYLILPIPRKTLILYIILSDLLRFWIWGTSLIYGVILYFCGALTVWDVVTLLFFILLNNYLIAFVKALISGYAILTYPLCLFFILFILLIVNLLSPVFVIPIIVFAILSLVVMLFFTLKENLYEELNRTAL